MSLSIKSVSLLTLSNFLTNTGPMVPSSITSGNISCSKETIDFTMKAVRNWREICLEDSQPETIRNLIYSALVLLYNLEFKH